MKETILLTDGYKLGHHFQYPEGTQILIRVEKGHVISGPSYIAYDMQSEEEEKQGCLETVFKDGKLLKDYTLAEIRGRIDAGL